MDWAGACESHLLGRAQPENGETVAQHLSRRDDERQARTPQRRIVDQEALGIIVTVKFAGQALEVERDLVRRELLRRAGDLAREIRDAPPQRLLVRAGQR